MINTFNIEYILLILIYIYLIFFININNNTKILFTIILIILCSNKIIKKYNILETYEIISKLSSNDIENIKNKDKINAFKQFLEYTYDGDDEKDLYLKNLKNYNDKLEIYEENFEDEENIIEEEYNAKIDEIQDEIDFHENNEEYENINYDNFDVNNFKYENYNIKDFTFVNNDEVWVIKKGKTPIHAKIIENKDVDVVNKDVDGVDIDVYEFKIEYSPSYDDDMIISNIENITSDMIILPRENNIIKIPKNLNILNELKDELRNVNNDMNMELKNIRTKYKESKDQEKDKYTDIKNKNNDSRLDNKNIGANNIFKLYNKNIASNLIEQINNIENN